MLTIGDSFPDFKILATVSTDFKSAFTDISNKSYPGKWLCVFFYPKSFSFVCPTELKGFADLHPEFQLRDCQILAASVDSEYVHLAWRRDHKDLRELPFPMLADVKRELSQALGIIDRHEGVSMRATFIVDPDSVIRYVDVTDLNVGRNVKEVLRVLDALQTNAMCPCDWNKGDATLKAA